MNQTNTEFEDDVVVAIDDHVALVTLNAPARLNALRPSTIARLRETFLELDCDRFVRTIVITGAGRGFCTGADVSDIASKADRALTDGGAPSGEALAARRRADTAFTPRRCGVFKPTLVAVNGVCNAAGLHFVADADIAIASDAATFLDTHVSIGQVTALEPILFAKTGIPLNAVLRMVVLGRNERIDATTALSMGLVSEVVPGEQLMSRTRELASMAAQASPAAVQASLKVIWQSLDLPLADAYQAGHTLIGQHRTHPDALEGARAFLEKRPPRWSDGTGDDR